MAKVMMNIRAAQMPSLAQVQQQYGLADHEIDKDFGVIETDPDDHLYTIRVDTGAAAKVGGGGKWVTEGPFSDPKISTFGPPISQPK